MKSISPGAMTAGEEGRKIFEAGALMVAEGEGERERERERSIMYKRVGLNMTDMTCQVH